MSIIDHSVNFEGNKSELQAYANQKMEEYGLVSKGWKFRFNNSDLGTCSPRRKCIYVNLRAIKYLDPSVNYDTVRHEIAHALIFERYHMKGVAVKAHGPEWKKQAVAVGAKPQATQRVNYPIFSYRFVVHCGELPVAYYLGKPRSDFNSKRMSDYPPSSRNLVVSTAKDYLKMYPKMNIKTPEASEIVNATIADYAKSLRGKPQEQCLIIEQETSLSISNGYKERLGKLQQMKKEELAAVRDKYTTQTTKSFTEVATSREVAQQTRTKQAPVLATVKQPQITKPRPAKRGTGVVAQIHNLLDTMSHLPRRECVKMLVEKGYNKHTVSRQYGIWKKNQVS